METVLDILYQDDHYVAVHKPAGLLVHRTTIDRHETRFAVQLLREQIGTWVWPCHRLDKPTSGVLLFALHKDALSLAHRAFAEQRVHKQYLAVVRGWIPEEGRLDYPLKPDKRNGRKGTAKDAATAYRPLEFFEIPFPSAGHPSSRFSLMELLPETGRTHQLRRHMKHLRHPIIGDTCHGDSHQNTLFREHLGCRRLLLTATRLRLSHPITSAPLHIECEPAERFQRVLGLLRVMSCKSD